MACFYRAIDSLLCAPYKIGSGVRCFFQGGLSADADPTALVINLLCKIEESYVLVIGSIGSMWGAIGFLAEICSFKPASWRGTAYFWTCC